MTSFFEKPLWPLIVFIIFYIIMDVLVWFIISYKENNCMANTFVFIRGSALIVCGIFLSCLTLLLNLINYKIINMKIGTFILLLFVAYSIIGNIFGLYGIITSSDLGLTLGFDGNYDPSCDNNVNICGRLISLC